jgi:hypothetical protein
MWSIFLKPVTDHGRAESKRRLHTQLKRFRMIDVKIGLEDVYNQSRRCFSHPSSRVRSSRKRTQQICMRQDGKDREDWALLKGVHNQAHQNEPRFVVFVSF